ncbi:MAG TPA: VWA domain-containing protein [Blastocatellia bacterium]|nr:VWA domain-containing protein [Blastocatellia bacterium]
MNLRLPCACLSALIAIAFLPPRLQKPSANSSEQAAQRPVNLHVDLVVLDAEVVQKKTARIVGGLNKDDFTLYEDGVKQEITQFGQDALPLSVLLLVDRAGCLDPFNDEVREATLSALDRLKPTDEVALMSFASDTHLIEGFTYDHKRITNGISRMPGHDETADHCFSTAFYDAASFMRRASNPAGRRAIVMITAETRDIGCDTGPTRTDARDALLESGAVVCGLIPSMSGQRIENGLIGGISFLFKVPSTTLTEFVEETGGETFKDKPGELDRAFGTLMDHLRSRYTIGFVSSNTKRDGTYRKLKLVVAPAVRKREGDVVAITRRGYLAAKGSSMDAHSSSFEQ